MYNVGRYTFKDKNGKQRKSIWDISKEEVPRFMYG
jgi:hypothetical protein